MRHTLSCRLRQKPFRLLRFMVPCHRRLLRCLRLFPGLQVSESFLLNHGSFRFYSWFFAPFVLPCLIGAGGAVPTDRRTAVSTILDFPIYATCVSSVCGSLAAIQPLFTVVANIIVLAVFVFLFIFLALLTVIRASITVLVIFETLPV